MHAGKHGSQSHASGAANPYTQTNHGTSTTPTHSHSAAPKKAHAQATSHATDNTAWNYATHSCAPDAKQS